MHWLSAITTMARSHFKFEWNSSDLSFFLNQYLVHKTFLVYRSIRVIHSNSVWYVILYTIHGVLTVDPSTNGIMVVLCHLHQQFSYIVTVPIDNCWHTDLYHIVYTWPQARMSSAMGCDYTGRCKSNYDMTATYSENNVTIKIYPRVCVWSCLFNLQGTSKWFYIDV